MVSESVDESAVPVDLIGGRWRIELCVAIACMLAVEVACKRQSYRFWVEGECLEAMEVDPDYAGFDTDADADVQQKRARIIEENARDAAVGKIQAIIDEQFSKEIEAKEEELMTINKRLAEARCVMDRLRACVVASYYAASFTKPVDGAAGPDPGVAYHPAIQNVMRKAVTSVLSRNVSHYQQTPKHSSRCVGGEEEASGGVIKCADNEIAKAEEAKGPDTPLKIPPTDVTLHQDTPAQKKKSKAGIDTKQSSNLGSRQRIKKTIVVGNVSKYISPDQREGSDKSTHKWMVYVRGAQDEPRIDHFVRKVWFFLHPSYRPNDLVEVCEAPFHLTRRGWGEFPIRVQVHFCDRRNRPVDIIHQLRLDRTYTGLQTLGAETVCEVEIDESSVKLSVDAMLDAAGLSTLPIDHVELPDVKLTDLSEKRDVTPDSVKCEAAQTSEAASENLGNEAVAASSTSAMDVNYADKNQFQPVTTSCTISSDTVSPPRKAAQTKGLAPPDDKQSPDSTNAEAQETEAASTGDQEDKKNMSEDGHEEVEEKNISPRRRRKRRRDSSRLSVSESEPDLSADDKAKKPLVDQGVSGTENAAVSTQVATAEMTGKITAEESQSMEVNNATTASSESEGAMIVDAGADSKKSTDGTGGLHAGSGKRRVSEDTSNSDGGNVVEATSQVTVKLPQLAKEHTTSPPSSGKPTAQKVVVLGTSSKGSETSPLITTLKGQPIVLLSKSSVDSSSQVRLRSASDGDGVPGVSCTGLMRSGLNVTPVINVKIQQESSRPKSAGSSVGGSPLRKIVPSPSAPKYIVLESRQAKVGKAAVNPGQVILSPLESGKVKQNIAKLVSLPQVTIKAEAPPGALQTNISVPLSSILKTGVQSSHPSAGKKPQVITVKAATTPLKQRQKRSLSADQSPKHTISLIPISANELKQATQGVSQASPTIQVQIVSSAGVKHTSKTTTKSAGSTAPTLSLQALKSVLSASGQKLTPQDEGSVKNVKTTGLAGQQQYVLATVVNPQGKQQLALINPSSLSLGGAKKVTNLSKGKKSHTQSTKSPGHPKVSMKSLKATGRKPSQEEAIAILNKLMPDPVYKVVGDSIQVKNLTSMIDDALPQVVKRVPLVSAERCVTKFPFCALSEAHFLDWNVGKQRAAEWQRAILVRRVLKYLQNKSEILRDCQLPSKKFIMNWCLKHGYSVFTDEYEDQADDKDECPKECTSEVDSMSSAGDILKKLQSSLEDKISQKRKSSVEDSDLEVDIITIDDSPAKRIHIKEEPPEELSLDHHEDSATENEPMVNVETLRNSKEVEAIADMTRKMGFDFSSMHGIPVCHMLLAKAMHQLVESVVRSSLSNALTRRDGSASVQRVAPDGIEVADVIKTVLQTSSLDFVTDRNIAEGFLESTSQASET